LTGDSKPEEKLHLAPLNTHYNFFHPFTNKKNMKPTIKNITILVALLLGAQHLAINALSAQCSTTPTPVPKIAASVFPIGGADFGLDLGYLTCNGTGGPYLDFLTQLSNAGLNSIWYIRGLTDNNQLYTASHMRPGMTTYYGASAGVTTDNYYIGINNITGIGRQGSYAPEVRYFLATNNISNHSNFAVETRDQNNTAIWKAALDYGVNINVGGIVTEWKITPPTSATPSTPVDVLQFELDCTTSTNNAGYLCTNNSGTMVPVKDTKFVCDFIYSFQGATTGSSDYDLTFAFLNASGGSISTPSPVHPSSSAVTTYYSVDHTVKGDNFEYPSMLNFPDKTFIGHSNLTSSAYAVESQTFDMSTAPSAGWKLIVTLTAKATTNIFVRGIRIRSQTADDLLKGKLDNTAYVPGYIPGLSSTCRRILDDFIPQSSGGNNVSYLWGWSEPTVELFPAIAYVASYWQNYTKNTKYATPLLTPVKDAADYRWYRYLYRDVAAANLGAGAACEPRFISQEAENMYTKTGSWDVNLPSSSRLYVSDNPSLDKTKDIYDLYNATYSGTVDGIDGSLLNQKLRALIPPLIPRDAIPNSIRTASGFTDFGFTIVPDGVNGSKGSGDHADINLAKAYELYTASMQGSAVGGVHVEGHLEKSSDDHGVACEAANTPLGSVPLPGSPPGTPHSWYAWIETHMDFPLKSETYIIPDVTGNPTALDFMRNGTGRGGFNPGVDYWYRRNSSELSTAGITTSLIAGFNATSYLNDKAHIFGLWDNALTITGQPDVSGGVYNLLGINQKPYEICDHMSSTNPEGSDGQKFEQHMRSQFRNEIRAEGWDAIAWGAKGIFFNNFGNDGQGDDGTDSKFNNGYDSWLDPANSNKLMSIGNDNFGNCSDQIVPVDGSSTGFTDLMVLYTEPMSPYTKHYYWIPISGTNGYLHYSSGSLDPAASNVKTWIEETYQNNNSVDCGGSNPVCDPANWQHYLHPTESGCPTNPKNWVAGFNNTHYIDASTGNASPWSEFYYPNNISANLYIAYPIFYGFQEHWVGATIFAGDLQHCARTLANLNWIGTYSLPAVSLSKNTGTTAGMALYNDFIKNSPFFYTPLHGYKVNRSATYPITLSNLRGFDSVDPEDQNNTDHNIAGISMDKFSDETDDRRLFEIGFFTGKNPLPKYCVFANKRTWPYSTEFVSGNSGPMQVKMHDGGSDDAHAMLGAIDVRAINGYVDYIDQTKWPGIDSKYLKRFVITDYRDICHPQVKYINESFNFLLDPGEGTLLSFHPYLSFRDVPPCIWGIAQFAYWGIIHGAVAPPFNNGGRTSSLESSATSLSYQMTFISSGSVAVSYPVEGIDSIFARRHLGTPADSLIDSNQHCADPVISAHANAPQEFALAYSMDSTGTGSHHDSTSVIFRIARTSAPYNYGTGVRLDIFKTRTDNYTRATPVITPAKGCGKWWVAYRNPDKGGIIMLIDTNGNILSQKTFSAGDPSTTRFITITSHLAKDTTVHDTVFMAFEEGPRQMGSTVYYLEAFRTTSSIDTARLTNICRGLPDCEHHYPNIAMTKTGGVAITWEMIASHFHYTDSTFNLIRTHYVMLHAKYNRIQTWTNYMSFKAFDDPVVHSVDDTLSAFPVVTCSDYDAARVNDTIWCDRLRLVWHNPFDEQAHISHFGYMNGGNINPFEDVMMPDASLWPTSPARTKYNGVLQPLMYTHPTYADDTLYSPEITIYDFPISTLQHAAPLKQVIVAKPKLSACGMAVVGAVGGLIVSRDTLLLATPWLVRDTVMNDTTEQYQFNWNDTLVRTANFTIQSGDTLSYGRYFRAGNYQAGDTNTLKGYLYNSYDYVKMQVNLRYASNHALIKTIDSCMLFSGGFYQSGNLNDNGLSKSGFTSSISGNVYLSFDVMRGNTSNSFEVFNNEVFDDTDMIDFIPGPALPDTAFKTPEPKPQAAPFISQVTMSVHPNPFRTETHVELEVPKDVLLNVTVFDILGRSVTNLFNNYSDRNDYNFILGAKQLNAGMYYVRVQCGGEVVTRKIELMK